ncbi:hypothetical protein [Amycolatopsis sp. NPDC057786]|uniref:hypothetical protein n=1 Tax=Amycolatopsis sp. NPDC057786 TaxID=3346250 RepID=UPI00366F0AA9
MQAPWWTTIAAAIAGGLIALTATVLTSALTAVVSGRRQRLELAHARSLEREKLLYIHRLPLYLEILHSVDQIDSDLSALRRFCEENPFGKKQRHGDSQKLLNEINSLAEKRSVVVVVSDMEVTEAFIDFCSGVALETSSLDVGDLERSRPDSSERWDLVPKRARLYDDLVNAIRREIGSRTDKLDGRHRVYVETSSRPGKHA